jgi:hypothetical protein
MYEQILFQLPNIIFIYNVFGDCRSVSFGQTDRIILGDGSQAGEPTQTENAQN